MLAIRWIAVTTLALAVIGKIAFPTPSVVMSPIVKWGLVVFECFLIVGLIRRPSRSIAAGLVLLGFGGWLWVAAGRECDCFGAMVRLGRAQHLVLSGLIVAAGAHLWGMLGRGERSEGSADGRPPDDSRGRKCPSALP